MIISILVADDVNGEMELPFIISMKAPTNSLQLFSEILAMWDFQKNYGSTHFQAVSCSILGQIAWFFFLMSTFNQSGGAHNIILIYIYCGILLDNISTWIWQFAAAAKKQGCYIS